MKSVGIPVSPVAVFWPFTQWSRNALRKSPVGRCAYPCRREFCHGIAVAEHAILILAPALQRAVLFDGEDTVVLRGRENCFPVGSQAYLHRHGRRGSGVVAIPIKPINGIASHPETAVSLYRQSVASTRRHGCPIGRRPNPCRHREVLQKDAETETEVIAACWDWGEPTIHAKARNKLRFVIGDEPIAQAVPFIRPDY